MHVEEYHIAISVEMFTSRHGHNNLVYWAESIRGGADDFNPNVMRFCDHVADYMLTQNSSQLQVLRDHYASSRSDQFEMVRVLKLADDKLSGTSYIFTYPPGQNVKVWQMAEFIRGLPESRGVNGQRFCECLAAHIMQPNPKYVLEMHRHYQVAEDQLKLNELLLYTVQEMKKMANRVSCIEAHLVDCVTRSADSIRIRGFTPKDSPLY